MVQSVVMNKPWPAPSPRVRELMRRGAEIVLNPKSDWVAELHDAVLSGPRMGAVAQDAALAEAIRRANLSNLVHWAVANIEHPGRPVSPNVGSESLELARDFVRRGLDGSALDAYRTGQNAAWRRWMEISFELTSDPAELRELLDVSLRSISTFLDDTIAALAERIDAERHELTHGSNAERRAAVSLLLEGAPIGRRRAEEQLGYGLSGPHVAAVVWNRTGGGPKSELAAHLETAGEALMRVSGATRRLTIVASAASMWVWMPVGKAPRAEDLAPAVAAHPDVRVAVGRPGVDLDGFRRSHLDAVAAQRMLSRLTPVSGKGGQQIARYEDVQLVGLISADPAQAEEFLADTLGPLLTAEAEVRDTLRTYVLEQFNTSRTAQRLFTHRNTVIRRLARADELLPRPLAENVVHVVAALELLRWRGEV
jgi:DNA-binding PucR family transcriptional regulator